MSVAGPFYFAWVDPDQTTFDESTMLRMDEDIFAMTVKQDEGQIATLDLTIKNPRVGLLNSGRKLWAHLAYRRADNGHVVPLFFGVLVSVPSNMFAELVQIKLNARPHDYIERKQAVAETLKVRPYYDPVFLDEAHRDDADAILEGWSSLYHVDRVTHEVTASDILEGEDGTITFDQTEGFYESVSMELGECPLDSVQVQADVTWTQRYIGTVPGPDVNVTSYTGGSFKGDWPKPGSEIGGGWRAEQSFVNDIFGTGFAKALSQSGSSNNNDPDAEDCSTDSVSVSMTSCPTPGVSIDGSFGGQTGICSPDGENADGSIGINVPMKVQSSGTSALLWQLNCRWVLRYDAKRDFTETAIINVVANVQDTVTSPTVEQNSELIKLSGANVGEALITPDAWSDFAGESVGVSQIIFPNVRGTPGGTAYQICTTAGVAGDDEPVFSDIPGITTTDGSVIWTSLGTSPPEQAPQWSDSSPVPLGEIVLYEPKVFHDDSGQFETTGEACYLIAMTAGTTNNVYHDFTYLPGITSNDDSLPLPVTTTYFDGPGQTDPYDAPIFSAGTFITDGTVRWMSLGTNPSFLSIPIGGTVENVTARSYFTKDRGLWSIEYLIAKARARLRLRARCVKVKWQAPFETCLDLSCRKNATLLDDRIPGGAATGKIISYSLTADQSGKLEGEIEIGVAVGFGNSVSEITGTPEYTDAGSYMEDGYQQFDGGTFTVGDDEIAYTPPIFAPFDDGLSFPLQFFPGRVVFTSPNQIPDVEAAISLLKRTRPDRLANSVPTTISQTSDGPGGHGSQTSNALAGTTVGNYLNNINPIEYELEAKPVCAEVIIPPVTNGPFNGMYSIECSTLEIPQGINLGA